MQNNEKPKKGNETPQRPVTTGKAYELLIESLFLGKASTQATEPRQSKETPKSTG